MTGTITEKAEARLVSTRFGSESRVANAILSDDSGKIKLVLWNDQIDLLNVGDTARISNGYCTQFRGEAQLQAGRFGSIQKAI